MLSHDILNHFHRLLINSQYSDDPHHLRKLSRKIRMSAKNKVNSLWIKTTKNLFRKLELITGNDRIIVSIKSNLIKIDRMKKDVFDIIFIHHVIRNDIDGVKFLLMKNLIKDPSNTEIINPDNKSVQIYFLSVLAAVCFGHGKLAEFLLLGKITQDYSYIIISAYHLAHYYQREEICHFLKNRLNK